MQTASHVNIDEATFFGMFSGPLDRILDERPHFHVIYPQTPRRFRLLDEMIWRKGLLPILV